MKFSFSGTPASQYLANLGERIKETFQRHGHIYEKEVREDTKLVFNFTTAENPRAFRRRSQAIFVVSVIEAQHIAPTQEEAFKAAYPLLIRSLSNLLLYSVPRRDGTQRDTYFVTLERGIYSVKGDPSTHDYYEEIYRRLEPLASSTLVIKNEFHPDLPEDLWKGCKATEDIKWASRRLGELDLLPAPFPIQEIVRPEDFRHIQHLYGIGGLSYGNLSARHDETRFWMSASGVNKTNLETIGRDILLVKGYDPEKNAMLLSVPPNVEPRRVSVDAIEHWFIYSEHPGVGAILHLHAWMDGVVSTDMNYPCGTYELGKAVAEVLRRAPDPTRAVVGLKNHGLTITGKDLREIFQRIEGRIRPQVKME